MITSSGGDHLGRRPTWLGDDDHLGSPLRGDGDVAHQGRMITDIALLINPAARRGRAGRVARDFATSVRQAGLTVRELVGGGSVQSAELAATAVREGCGALVACGGDGTVHVALQAVAGSQVPLGVVAAGAGNDFARAIGLPVDNPAPAAAVVLDGVTRAVDLGRVGERWFGTVLAAGFDSLVADRMNTMRWPSGRARYPVAIAATLARFRPLPFVIEVDGARRELEAMLVAVGNGPSYGGGMRVCPGAAVDDGLFDVTVVRRLSRPRFLRLFPSVYSGEHVRYPEVETFRCSAVALSCPGVAGYGDGEFVSELPLTCEVVPGALQVLVPG